MSVYVVAVFCGALAIVTLLFTTRGASVPALDAAAPAVISKDTLACQSPWQVLEGRACRPLSAGTEVNVVGGDDFFACIVWPGAQRCMWVARDALRKR